METFFMNTKNSKTGESNEFVYHLTDKLNLINPNKNMALANLSIYYTWKNNNRLIIIMITDLRFQHQHGMKRLIYQMDLIQLLVLRIILNILSKNMKLLRALLQY